MSSKNSINFRNIVKRSSCLNSVCESIDSQRLFSQLKEDLSNLQTSGKSSIPYSIQSKFNSYIDRMCNIENASDYYYQPFELIGYLNESDNIRMADIITKEYTNRILPYANIDMNIIKEALEFYNLTVIQKNAIIESCDNITTADRIIHNHKNLSKRFNLEKEIMKYRTVGMKYVVESFASKIDTYNTSNYQKMNITIEEVSYLLDLNGFKYDKSELAKCVLEYYLTSKQFTSQKEMNDFRTVLQESFILDDNDIKNSIDILDGRLTDNISIKNSINKYIITPDKNAERLYDIIHNTLLNTSNDDIIENIDNLILFLWSLIKNNTFEDSESSEDMVFNILSDAISLIVDKTSLSVDHDNFTKEEIIKINSRLKDAYSKIEEISSCDIAFSEDAEKFLKSLDRCISRLDEISNFMYNKDNIDAINNIVEATLPLDVYKRKFQDIAKSAHNLDNFLEIKERKSDFDFTNRSIINMIESVEEMQNNMYSYIDDTGRSNICVRQYQIEESDVEDVHKLLSQVCNEYNDLLTSQNSSYKSYYIINPYIAEVRIKESMAIDIDDDIREKIDESIDPSLCTYLRLIDESNNITDYSNTLDKIDIEHIITNLESCDNFTMEHFELALEIMSYIDIDESLVKQFGENFVTYNFNKAVSNRTINESYMRLSKEERYINSIIENRVELTEVPVELQLEAYSLLTDLFIEAGYKYDEDDDNNEDDEEDDEKKEKKPEPKKEEKKDSSVKISEKDGKRKTRLNLNDIKLGVKGLATQFKTMTTKAKEIARNLDNAARAFYKAANNMMTNNRREAIIKGSLIPSFSRCLVAGITLAGISTVNLPLAIITAMGGIACSAHLNKKERLLLLDEIETELEVVDKELNIADSNNNMKKYRALLRYKKELQRQYQRIKYNIRIGKDIISSDVGVTNMN